MVRAVRVNWHNFDRSRWVWAGSVILNHFSGGPADNGDCGMGVASLPPPPPLSVTRVASLSCTPAPCAVRSCSTEQSPRCYAACRGCRCSFRGYRVQTVAVRGESSASRTQHFALAPWREAELKHGRLPSSERSPPRLGCLPCLSLLFSANRELDVAARVVHGGPRRTVLRPANCGWAAKTRGAANVSPQRHWTTIYRPGLPAWLRSSGPTKIRCNIRCLARRLAGTLPTTP